ncbi:MAG: type III-A CRISPR-associated protein Csm2 [Chloroflexota bacterium]
MSYTNRGNWPPGGNRHMPSTPSSQQSRQIAGGQHRSYIEIPSLDLNYLKGTYFDSEKRIKCELLTSEADRLAKLFKDSNVNYAQVRRFFAAVRAIDRDLEIHTYNQLQPQIQALKNKAAYFVGRGQGDRDKRGRENLKTFIDANVNLSMNSKESFQKGFVPHFEAVIAYLRYYKP